MEIIYKIEIKIKLIKVIININLKILEIIYKIEIKIKLIKVIININFKYIGNNKFIIILKFELNKLIKIIKIK